VIHEVNVQGKQNGWQLTKTMGITILKELPRLRASKLQVQGLVISDQPASMTWDL
jgi:hypothetical protein